MIKEDTCLRYKIWFEPCEYMDNAWWSFLGLQEWKDIYNVNPLVRGPLNQLIRKRLGHDSVVPESGGSGYQLFSDINRLRSVLLALGLWGLGCQTSLLLRTHRNVLKARLSDIQLTRLSLVLPDHGYPASVDPDMLLTEAEQMAYILLDKADNEILRATRILMKPVHVQKIKPSEYNTDSVISHLLRWI